MIISGQCLKQFTFLTTATEFQLIQEELQRKLQALVGDSLLSAAATELLGPYSRGPRAKGDRCSSARQCTFFATRFRHRVVAFVEELNIGNTQVPQAQVESPSVSNYKSQNFRVLIGQSMGLFHKDRKRLRSTTSRGIHRALEGPRHAKEDTALERRVGRFKKVTLDLAKTYMFLTCFNIFKPADVCKCLTERVTGRKFWSVSLFLTRRRGHLEGSVPFPKLHSFSVELVLFCTEC